MEQINTKINGYPIGIKSYISESTKVRSKKKSLILTQILNKFAQMVTPYINVMPAAVYVCKV